MTHEEYTERQETPRRLKMGPVASKVPAERSTTPVMQYSFYKQ